DGDGAVRGSAPAAIVDLLTRTVPHMPRSSTITNGSSEIFVELLRPPTTLVIFGAGAVSMPLVDFARNLGFETIVVDGRPQFANRERFPNAGELRIGIVSEIAS